jgi:hypothetical protein
MNTMFHLKICRWFEKEEPVLLEAVRGKYRHTDYAL